MKTTLITGACINTGVAIVEKFASEGYNVIFTGRNMEKVHAAEKIYREKFPAVEIIGYHIDSLLDERTVVGFSGSVGVTDGMGDSRVGNTADGVDFF